MPVGEKFGEELLFFAQQGAQRGFLDLMGRGPKLGLEVLYVRAGGDTLVLSE